MLYNKTRLTHAKSVFEIPLRFNFEMKTQPNNMLLTFRILNIDQTQGVFFNPSLMRWFMSFPTFADVNNYKLVIGAITTFYEELSYSNSDWIAPRIVPKPNK